RRRAAGDGVIHLKPRAAVRAPASGRPSELGFWYRIALIPFVPSPLAVESLVPSPLRGGSSYSLPCGGGSSCPLPPCGGGLGWGVASAQAPARGSLHPDPPPRGGRETNQCDPV